MLKLCLLPDTDCVLQPLSTVTPFKTPGFYITNVCVASLSTVMVSYALATFSRRVMDTWKCGQVWNQRTSRFAALVYVELVNQLVRLLGSSQLALHDGCI